MSIILTSVASRSVRYFILRESFFSTAFPSARLLRLSVIRALVVLVGVARLKISRIHYYSRVARWVVLVAFLFAICASSTNFTNTLKIEPYFLYHM
jgi:hypothetical protein